MQMTSVRRVIQQQVEAVNDTNLSDCCVGLQASATLEEAFLAVGEASGTSCGLF